MWEVALLVRERESDLDDLEEVDITPHGLVVVVRRRFECPYWTRDDSREFRVLNAEQEHSNMRERAARDGGQWETWSDHCDVGVLLDEVSDVRHLGLEVWCPYVPYS